MIGDELSFRIRSHGGDGYEVKGWSLHAADLLAVCAAATGFTLVHVPTGRELAMAMQESAIVELAELLSESGVDLGFARSQDVGQDDADTIESTLTAWSKRGRGRSIMRR